MTKKKITGEEETARIPVTVSNVVTTDEMSQMTDQENSFVAGFILAAEIYGNAPTGKVIRPEESKVLAIRYVKILRTARIGKNGQLI